MLWKLLGSLLLVKYGLSFGQFVWLMLRLYLLPKIGFKKNIRSFGEWAVVTGGTDGIGLALAKELARRGMKIVLISRSLDKLKTTAEEITKECGVEVKIVQFDFSKTDGYDQIRNAVKDLDVGILVNNVGMSYDHPDFYLHYSEQYYENVLNVNVTSILKMTRIVLEGMVSRKRGTLMHISSFAGTQMTPLLSVYSASKAFVNFFGQALYHEYKDQGISNQVVLPYFVATKLSKMRANGVMVPSPTTYARQCVDAVALSDKMAGFWSHELVFYALALLPEYLRARLVRDQMLATRKRWVKKQAKKEE